MVSREQVLRMLTIKPEDLAVWTRVCRGLNKQMATAHPRYPGLSDMQLLSYVKRLLPEIRAMISLIDKDTGNHDAI
jgi:hypothetical protein